MPWVPRGTLIPQVDQQHVHEQTSPSTVWLITHGLQFSPAGIQVTDHQGTQHYPQISYPNSESVQLRFGRPISGVARLS